VVASGAADAAVSSWAAGAIAPVAWRAAAVVAFAWLAASIAVAVAGSLMVGHYGQAGLCGRREGLWRKGRMAELVGTD